MSRRTQQIDALFQQVKRAHDAGQLAHAEQGYRQILAAQPNHAGSLHGLGLIALQVGQADAALVLIDQAIARERNTALFHVHRGHALLALGRAPDARLAAGEAVRLKRNLGEAHHLLGHALSDLGEPDGAVTAYREAVRLNPRIPDLHNALGLALREANAFEEAIAAVRQALLIAPNDPVATSNLAGLLKDTGQIAPAESLYRGEIRRNPADAGSRFNLAVLLLLAGRLPEAWPEWEWRFRADPSLAPIYDTPTWSGDALAGRTLLVHAEQGLGDVIQFCRYLSALPAHEKVVVAVQPPLVALLRRCFPTRTVVGLDAPTPDHAIRCPIMSLPFALGLTGIADILLSPYLTEDPDRVALWRDRLAATPFPKVGLVWAGNPDRMRMDRRRSIAPDRLLPLTESPGITFVSLQKPAGGKLLDLGKLAGRVIDWSDALTDFEDTAALVASLDLVIGVDTAVVHLAGALGKPVWLLNRADTCWRWMLGCDDSIWYPGLRQFRQTQPGQWDDVIARVAAALAAQNFQREDRTAP